MQTIKVNILPLGLNYEISAPLTVLNDNDNDQHGVKQLSDFNHI